MEKKLVYDLWFRIFHWVFFVFFLFSYMVAKYCDSDSWVYPLHMLAGLSLGFALILRFFWGFFGSRYSRWSSFIWSPVKLFWYFRELFRKDPGRWPGHNPASSWSSFLMFLLVFFLISTGLGMVQGNEAELEDLHEIFAHSLLVIAFLHFLGVLFHQIKNQDGLIWSIWNGKKKLMQPDLSIQNQRKYSSFLMVFLFIGFLFLLWQGYTPSERALKIFNLELYLGD